MNWLTLAFFDKTLEKSYQAFYFNASLVQYRIGFLIAIFLYAIFGVLDPYIIPEVKETAWLIRYAFVCPLASLQLFFSFSRYFERWAQVTMMVLTLSAGIGIIVMIVLAWVPGTYLYYAGLLLTCSFIYTYTRLRFLTASAVSWAITILYVILSIIIAKTSSFILLNNIFFLLGINLVGMSTCYFMDHSSRASFIRQKIITEQACHLERAVREIENARIKAEELSQLDPLTNLFNRRHFYALINDELEKNKSSGPFISAILIDIDHFKHINDTYGHLVGDQVLKVVAQRMSINTRWGDVHCRYGGEEFAVVLLRTDQDTALSVAERLRKNISSLPIETSKGQVSITVSAGVVTAPEIDFKNIDVLLNRADEALYTAKHTGRNRTVLWNAVASENSSYVENREESN
jgi:diguanylate cyclase (GGDEF)-like protein